MPSLSSKILLLIVPFALSASVWFIPGLLLGSMTPLEMQAHRNFVLVATIVVRAATLIVTAIILILLARSLQFGFVAFVVLFFFLNWPSMLFDLESPFSAFSPIMGFSGFYQPYEKLEVLTMTLCVHGAVAGMLYPFSRAATR